VSVHNHNHADDAAEAAMNQVAHELVGDLNREVQEQKQALQVFARKVIDDADTIAALLKECEKCLKHIHDEGEDHPLNNYKFTDMLRAAIAKGQASQQKRVPAIAPPPSVRGQERT
jgi:hypothetical protein